MHTLELLQYTFRRSDLEKGRRVDRRVEGETTPRRRKGGWRAAGVIGAAVAGGVLAAYLAGRRQAGFTLKRPDTGVAESVRKWKGERNRDD